MPKTIDQFLASLPPPVDSDFSREDAAAATRMRLAGYTARREQLNYERRSQDFVQCQPESVVALAHIAVMGQALSDLPQRLDLSGLDGRSTGVSAMRGTDGIWNIHLDRSAISVFDSSKPCVDLDQLPRILMREMGVEMIKDVNAFHAFRRLGSWDKTRDGLLADLYLLPYRLSKNSMMCMVYALPKFIEYNGHEASPENLIIALASFPAGFDIEDPHPLTRNPPLVEAVKMGDVRLVEAMLRCNFNISAPEVTTGKPPLLLAARSYQLVNLLLENGADISALDNEENTLLHEMASVEGTEELRRLVEMATTMGSDVSARNDAGDTASDVIQAAWKRRGADVPADILEQLSPERWGLRA